MLVIHYAYLIRNADIRRNMLTTQQPTVAHVLSAASPRTHKAMRFAVPAETCTQLQHADAAPVSPFTRYHSPTAQECTEGPTSAADAAS
jgi:hypothetical protein